MSNINTKLTPNIPQKDILLNYESILAAKDKLDEGWILVNDHHLEKEYLFKDFKEALAFTNRVGASAEAENHHPDLHLSWGRVKILIWTHKVNGLTEMDFILATKCDQQFKV